MSYKRTKTGKNSYSTYNTKTGVHTSSLSSGGKKANSPRITRTNKSNGVSYTTTTSNMNGYVTTTRSNYYNPKTQFKTPKAKNTSVKIKETPYKFPKVKYSRTQRTYRYRSGSMNFKYTPQLFLISIILLLIVYIIEKIGY